MFSLRQSFDEHSDNYGTRVRDRTKYPDLSIEDRIITSMFESNVPKGKELTLIDAGCGTGDRLQMLMKTFKDHLKFRRIIGLDYSQRMLQYAAQKQADAGPLYDQLRLVDLNQPLDTISGDIVLCLWGIVNGSGVEAEKLLANLGGLMGKEGFVVYDVMTTMAHWVLKQREVSILVQHPEIRRYDDPQMVWYERDDASLAYLRLFSPQELSRLMRNTRVPLFEMWGFNHHNLRSQKIRITHGGFDLQEASQFTGLLFFHHGPALNISPIGQHEINPGLGV